MNALTFQDGKKPCLQLTASYSIGMNSDNGREIVERINTTGTHVLKYGDSNASRKGRAWYHYTK